MRFMVIAMAVMLCACAAQQEIAAQGTIFDIIHHPGGSCEVFMSTGGPVGLFQIDTCDKNLVMGDRATVYQNDLGWEIR